MGGVKAGMGIGHREVLAEARKCKHAAGKGVWRQERAHLDSIAQNQLL